MPDFQEAFNILDKFIEERAEAFSTPALAVAITDREQMLYEKYLGFANLEARTQTISDTLFELGSIGKSFTGVAALQAHEAGMLDLHAPVTDYLP